MTEIEVTIAPPATALANSLSNSEDGTTLAFVPYLGSLTPQRFDSAELETEALLGAAAVHDLGWLRRIAVRGEDRFRWLSGMVTNGVESLPHRAEFGSGAYNLVLNAQGRIQGDCWVWRNGDELEIEVAADQSDALLAHFDRFIVMDDVELVPLDGQSALGITGPGATRLLAELGLAVLPESISSAQASINQVPVRLCRNQEMPVEHYALWTSVEEIPSLWESLLAAGARPVGSDAIESLRIFEGIPAYGIDIQSRDLAQETSQDRALSFTKGCYLGQEIVERVRSRGQVHRHLRSLELFPDTSGQLPIAGTELRIANGTPESKTAGNLTSVAQLHRNGVRRIFGIGMVRAEAEVGSQTLTYPGGIARILTATPKWNDGWKAAEETA